MMSKSNIKTLILNETWSLQLDQRSVQLSQFIFDNPLRTSTVTDLFITKENGMIQYKISRLDIKKHLLIAIRGEGNLADVGA